MNALGIWSNQIDITISSRALRSRSITAQVRFFSTATTSADSLLTSTRAQLANSSSALRQADLTSQLNETSITNIKQYYTCSNGVVQESPCASNDSSNSETKLSTILLASIIPTVFVVVILATVVFFIMKRRRSYSSDWGSFRMERL